MTDADKLNEALERIESLSAGNLALVCTVSELRRELGHSQVGVNEIRDDCERRLRIRAEHISELEATLKRKDAEIVARGEYVERLQALLAEYRGAPSVWLSPDANGFLHAYANGETRYLRDPHPPKEGE